MNRLLKRMFTLITLPSLFLVTGNASAMAINCDCDGFEGSFDTTITFGVGWRVSDQDNRNIGFANPGPSLTARGSYPTLNEDDGNLNYAQWDVYQALLKITNEIDLRFCNWSVFSRVQTLYDFDVIHGNTKRSPLTKRARHLIGEDIRLLDLYVTWDTEAPILCCKPMSIRFGQQALNWGESVFIPNGLNVISPFDVSKLRTAGAELRDALLPIPMVRIDLEICPELTIGAWWQFWWRETRLDPKGTYFSTNDFISPGGSHAMIITSAGPFPGSVPPNDLNPCYSLGCAAFGQFGYSVYRGEDKDGHNTGSYGVYLNYFAEELNNTELGLYFSWYASRLPLISIHKGNLAGGAATLIPSSTYFVEYPDDIKVLGISFNTMVGTVAVQGEYSYHMDQPLQIDDTQLLLAGLTISPQLGFFPSNTYIQGYRRKEYSQAQVAFTKNFGTKFGADQSVMLAEFGMTRIHNLESVKVLHYEAPGTAWGYGYGQKFAAGYRMLFRSTYNNFFCNWNFFPQIAFSHDLFGTLPAPLTHFVKDRMQVTVSGKAIYQNRMSAEIAYTNFFGGGVHNLLRDRDFLTLSVSYSF